MASAELEKILQKLLLPDNNAIQQASLELKTAFTKPDIVIPALVQLLQQSNEPTIRQYCAILLRRRVVKQWKNVPAPTKNSLKGLLIEAVTKEKIDFVRASICQVIGCVAKHELGANTWPELLQFISTCIRFVTLHEREVGFLLLKAVCETASEQLQPWYAELFAVFQVGLSDSESKNNAFYCIRSITSLLQYFGSDEEVLLKPMLGGVMEIIKNLLKVDEEKANEALDIFDELVQIEVGIIKPYVKSLVEFCMQIMGCSDFDDGIRVKALYLVCWACRRKCKLLLKSKLLEPLILLLVSMLSIPSDEDDIEGDGDEVDELNSLQSVAGQALDLLALHSPPDKLIPVLMQAIGPLFASTNEYERKSAYIALGELAEGCADHIRTRYLQNAIDTIMKGLTDEKAMVRNAALFAMGQYGEFVQPEVGKYHATILPVLLTFLQTVIKDSTNHKGTLTKLFYAIEKFTEGLEKDMVNQYTHGLIEAFISLLKSSTDSHTTELAISAIGALVSSAQEHLTSYFPIIMENLKVFLTQPLTLETLDVYSQTIDTLGALVRYMSVDVIKPVAPECMELGIRILSESDDPDLRRCTYGLFASLSVVLKQDMLHYLDQIGPLMISSLKSTEGIITTDDSSTKEDPLFLIEDELDDEDLNDEDDDDEGTGYAVENAYMEEKEDTINALTEIVENTGDGIISSLNNIYKEIFLLTEYPHSNVRKAAVSGGCRLCAVMCQHMDGKNPNEITEYITLAKNSISSSLRVSTNIINADDDRDVVIAVVEGLTELLRHLKHPQLVEKQEVKLLGDAVVDIIKGQAACQQFIDEDNLSQASGDDNETSAELDLMLIEKAGDLLPFYVQLIGGELFKHYFTMLLPYFMKKTKKHCTVAEKSFAVGTVAEVIQAMGASIIEYIALIAPWLLKAISDEDDEVRSNSAFALGVLCENGKDNMLSYYMTILECFHTLLSSGQQAALVQDNTCGAIARMIMTSPQNIPFEQVLPVLVNCLPIKEDERENETVTKCVLGLYISNTDMMMSFMDKLLPWFIQSIKDEKSGLQSGTREKLQAVVGDIQSKFPERFQAIINGC